MHRSPRRPAWLRTCAATVSLLLLLLWPTTSAAAMLSQSGSGESMGAELDAGGSTITIAATTGGYDAEGGVLLEHGATSAGAATPVRVTDEDGIRLTPGTVTVTAPGDETASTTLQSTTATDGDGATAAFVGFASSYADAGESLDHDPLFGEGSNVGVDDAGVVTSVIATDVTLAPGTLAETTIPEVHTFTRVETHDEGSGNLYDEHFTVSSVGEMQQDGSVEAISIFGGYILVDWVRGAAGATFDPNGVGGASQPDARGYADYQVMGLRLLDMPGGRILIELLEASGVFSGSTESRTAMIRIQQPDGTFVQASITPADAYDLLAASTYAGTDLENAFASIGAQLAALTGEGGPLEALSIVVGEGYAESGGVATGSDTYARGFVEPLRISALLGGTLDATLVLASSAASIDSVNGSSTMTDPATPLGAAPTSDPAGAFPAVRETLLRQVHTPRSDPDAARAVTTTPSAGLPNTGLALGALALLGTAFMLFGAAASACSRERDR